MLQKVYRASQQIFISADKSSDIFTVSYKLRDDLKKFFPPQKYCFLEIGCYRGMTARELAPHFIQYLGLDINRKNLFIARLANLFNANVRFQRFDLYGSDWKLLNFPASVVFIDADHSYEHVRQDIDNCIKHYKEAFVVFDDYGAWEGVYKAVNEAVADNRLEILQEIGVRKGELNSSHPNYLGSEGLICRIV